ncbi:aminoglycoside phosphotransferase family protein [Paludibacter sp. 221]|uniref:phosphotransferase enzyme family protein n=1 Tax=Paludibacter sp. 221 TaxID=2302939 RepID=UPI0013D0A3E7|nr:aminoglycoside phosphotransferase family protein [Paludibacter sp. 221]NDV47130.1 aminoglycoside phosphotransferase family protein [Paludibacter sp. 221]
MENIVKKFDISTETGNIRPLKIGHINDSFIIESKNPGEPSYFLQKINHHIFKDVEGLQRNIQLVTDHLRKKLSERGETDLDNKVLRLVPTKDGKLYYKDEKGEYWRIYINIENTHSYDVINPELAYKAGVAFGDFQCMLSDIDTKQLIETIPDFHNMEFRLQQFRDAVKDNAAGRLAETQWMADEIEKRAEEMCAPERLYREGKLVKRINHCDTKVNNMLFDKNDNVTAIVDLDTVMPGFVLSDFGDFMRTGANTGAEDDANLDNIGINLDIFEAYTKGYLAKATFLSPIELEYLAFGAKLLSYMQTVRFYTDYLNGDTYYKIGFPEHNWQRTKAQFKLLQSQEENFGKMQAIVLKYK